MIELNEMIDMIVEDEWSCSDIDISKDWLIKMIVNNIRLMIDEKISIRKKIWWIDIIEINEKIDKLILRIDEL
jgi:hypothetical protein